MLNGKWMIILGLLILNGCAPQLEQLPKAPKAKEETFWLKKSLYGGILYDDYRYRLLSPKPFDELRHLKTLGGDWILPPPSDEVVPFGTRVSIQKIEWPTGANIIKRPILTPRNLPWIYLTVALDRGSVTLNRDKTYILLVPEEIKTETALRAWLQTYLSKEDNNLWFLKLSPAQKKNILDPSK
ncbi:MAG: hypothetical protein V4534_00125 [Myxococcota bacterium]